MSVEQAYDRLPEPPEDDSGDGACDVGGGGPGASETGQAPDAGRDGAGRQRDDGDGEGAPGSPGDDAGRDGAGGEGPGETGPCDAPPSHDPSGTGEVMDAPSGAGAGDGGAGPSPADVTAEEQSWDEAMHQALSLAKAEGKVPGGVEETVRGAHASRLDWRALLRRHMTEAAKRDYTWSLPNPRFIDAGLYLPSIRSEGVGTLAVLVDTSGSLPGATLAAFWAEVRDVATEIQPESVVVVQVDAEVQDAAEYSTDDLPDEIAIKGRGGTDFRPGFEWLDAEGLRPGVCLYLTDMLCSSYPETEPDFPVLFCNYGRPPSDWNREPWGERIDIAL